MTFVTDRFARLGTDGEYHLGRQAAEMTTASGLEVTEDAHTLDCCPSDFWNVCIPSDSI